MRLAIADPPYLGRGNRIYGNGCGNTQAGRADTHPNAREWDAPERHIQLLDELQAFDGWAVACSPNSIPLYLAHAPADARLLIWYRKNAQPHSHRIRSSYEGVLTLIPEGSRAHKTGLARDDVLVAPTTSTGKAKGAFTGAKPPAWTRWILDVLGYDPDSDELIDMFPGSGAVTREIRQGVLPMEGSLG
jgi:hypothetical protein